MQAADLVRPEIDADAPPGHVQVRMVVLAVGEVADLDRERHRGFEIREAERALEPRDAVAAHHVPGRDLRPQRLDLVFTEWRLAAAARHARGLPEGLLHVEA